MTNEPKSPKAWANFLSTTWGPRFPIDVEQIALQYTKRFHQPIRQVVRDDIGDVDGMLYFSDKKNAWFIICNTTNCSVERQNFTVAHELGHFLCHRELRDSFECSASELSDFGGSDSVDIEKEANDFASYLLMPIDSFRKTVNEHGSSLETICKCAEIYRSSLQAAAIKWIEFTGEKAVFVVSRDGFVLWAKSSDLAFKNYIFFRKGSPVPQQSLAVSQLSYTKSLSGKTFPPGVWHDDYSAHEMTIKSVRHDMVYSLLKFS